MKTLEEIKQTMADGDTAQADEALKELLANEPDNLLAKMLYGTCRQLLGDEWHQGAVPTRCPCTIAVASSRKDHVQVVCGLDNLKRQNGISSWKATTNV